MVPIVLHHGLFGFGNFKLGPVKLSYFHKIDDAIERLGHPVITPRVHPTGSLTLREHLETWPADHWHTINKRFGLEGKDRTGDIVPYYLRVLARVVGD